MMEVTKKPSLFANEKKVMRRFPYALIVTAIILVRLLSSVPNSDKLFNVRIVRKIAGAVLK